MNARRLHPISVLTLCTVLSVACSDAALLGPAEPGPADPAEPGLPDPPVVTQPPASPVPSPGMSSLSVEGVFDLEATIVGFDPAWGEDLVGYRYLGVVTLRHDARYAPGIGGTFEGLHGLFADGTRDHWEKSGTITSYFYDGKVVVELVADDFHFTLEPIRTSGDDPLSRFEGGFGTGGHIYGSFTAERRPES